MEEEYLSYKERRERHRQECARLTQAFLNKLNEQEHGCSQDPEV